MDKIKIAITGRVASVVAMPEVVADNAEYEVDIALDPREGWSMTLPITALFVRRDGSYTARILDAGATSCTMPPQTGTNIVFVGLTQDDMRTTTPATIKVHRSIRTVAHDPLPAPSEDVYAQILAAYAGIKTLSGKGAPTSATQGKVNQLYRDEDTQKLYICTATDGGYTWAVSGGSVDVDATLTKAGYAADAKAAGDAIEKKIDKNQGVKNAGKILGVNEDGNVVPQNKSVQALAGAAAPTTATAGVVGQEYYVIADGAVAEMYVCTAAANGAYTWDKAEFGAEIDDTSTELTKVWSAEKSNQISQDVAKLQKKKAEIDDTAVGANAWSSKNIVDMLCPPLEESGNPVVCYPVAGYPLGVKAKWEPVQEGSGTPSPENIRPIKGRDSVTVERQEDNQVIALTLPETVFGGEVDANTGAGEKQWELITIKGDEPWIAPNSKAYYAFFGLAPSDGVTNGFCTHYPYGRVAGHALVNKNGAAVFYGFNALMTVAEWIAFLAAQYAAGTPVQICYKRAEPVPCTATGAQLLPALAGANTVLTDADSATVTGRADPIKRITDLEDAVASQT